MYLLVTFPFFLSFFTLFMPLGFCFCFFNLFLDTFVKFALASFVGLAEWNEVYIFAIEPFSFNASLVDLMMVLFSPPSLVTVRVKGF